MVRPFQQCGVWIALIVRGRGKRRNSFMETNVCSQQDAELKNDRKLLDALRQSKVYRQYEKAFCASTSLPLPVWPVQSFELPFHGKKNENGFCAFLADRKGACALCLQTQEDVGKQQGEPYHVRCPFGLTETRVPVQLGERLIGYLQVGQVFTQAPKTRAFKKAIQRVLPAGSTLEKKAMELSKQTRMVPAEQYAASVQLLKFFAKQLSGMSNQILIEEAKADSPVITKAREFIAAHKTEALSLAAVAKVAGASVFHFCKIFHKSTGLNFTDYVARARVEDARRGLLNPNRRISEIAYDVGFQSLTQFNRTFKRIFGQSPSDHRENLTSRGGVAA